MLEYFFSFSLAKAEIVEKAEKILEGPLKFIGRVQLVYLRILRWVLNYFLPFFIVLLILSIRFFGKFQ